MALIADKLWSFVRQRLGLVFLLILLIIITIGTVKPAFYLLGWDNYSSYFSIPTNLFRTFFSAWREYRGLGVPSDSEVVDIFRQMFFFVFHFVVAEQVLDQLYIILCLCIGVIGMYVFASAILQKHSHSIKIVDAGAAIASLFYLFNLNTLAIFYFPIITYITRFAAIPVIFFVFWYLSTKRRIPLKSFVLICFALAFTAGSYITATVFITTVLSLGLWALFQKQFLRVITIFLFFFLINSFWIVPFFNYTTEKSSIIRLAPTFIDANESQLNKGKSFFDFGKQLILYPNFFDTTYSEISRTALHTFHRLGEEYTSQPTSIILYIFPFFYIVGSLFILAQAKKFRTELWIPLLLLTYFLLSMKEYSPLGFLYTFFDQHIPYFGVLFRFGDTKFHPYSAFAGSVAAGVFVVSMGRLYRSIRNKGFFLHPSIIILLAMIPTMWVYREYLYGNLVGSFMYNRLPSAYKEIASVINADPGSGRVLHLPFDKDAYWKSYAWGGIGSSFFHYMINKPFIDKTFEPASMEHAYLHKRLTDLLRNNQVLQDEQANNERIQSFHRLLYDLGVGYIVLDQTVSSSVYARGISFGGTFSHPDAKVLVDGLISKGLATRIRSEDVQILDFLGMYQDGHPLKESDHDALLAKGPFKIELIKIHEVAPKVTFEKNADVIDSGYKTVLQDEALPDSSVLYQSDKTKGTIFPFRRRDGVVSQNKGTLSLAFPDGSINGSYILSAGDQTSSKFIEVLGRRVVDDIIITLQWRQFPTIEDKEFLSVLGEVRFKTTESLNSTDNHNDTYRLVVNGQVLPLTEIVENDKKIGSLVLSGGVADISLLLLDKELSIDTRLFRLTEDPNCFGDKLEDYTYSVKTANGFGVTTQEGSTCWFYPLGAVLPKNTAHAELSLDISGEGQDFDGISSFETGKPNLVKYLLNQTKPVLLRICAFEPNIDECFNQHQHVIVSERGPMHINLEQAISGHEGIGILFALKTIGDQYADTNIHGGKILPYKIVSTESISLTATEEVRTIQIADNQELNVSFPFPSSRYSFSFDSLRNGYSVSNKPCEEKNSFRTFRTINSTWVSFVGNCYNQLFQSVPFDSSKFLLWTIEYSLLSGKYPKFILTDKLITYIDEYLSLYQGYPDVKNFKKLQNPESVTGLGEQGIEQILKNTESQAAYTYVPPQPEFGDHRQKEFTLHQHAENEGVMRVDSFNVLELPDSWRNFRMEPDSESLLNFATPSWFSSKQIIPSLWQIDIQMPAEEQSYLLNFHENIDRQWKVVFTQKPSGSLRVMDHGRCNGYSNCFILKAQGEGKARFYLFYLPEALAILGWTITAGAVGLFVLFWTRVSKKRS